MIAEKSVNTDLAVVCSGLVGLLAAWSADLLLGGERPHRGAGRAGAAAQPRRLQVSHVTRAVIEPSSRSFTVPGEDPISCLLNVFACPLSKDF